MISESVVRFRRDRTAERVADRDGRRRVRTPRPLAAAGHAVQPHVQTAYAVAAIVADTVSAQRSRVASVSAAGRAPDVRQGETAAAAAANVVVVVVVTFAGLARYVKSLPANDGR